MIISSTSHAPTQPGVDLMFAVANRHGFGLPEERLAQVAARRAFVEMKLRFMQAAKDIPGPQGHGLAARIRGSSQAIELWRLSDELLAALACGGGDCESHRLELRRQLGSVFQV